MLGQSTKGQGAQGLKTQGILAFIGQFTLEIYVLHFRFARLLGLGNKNLSLYTPKGLLWLLAAFLLMSVLTTVCIFALKKIALLDLILFGKLPARKKSEQ